MSELFHCLLEVETQVEIFFVRVWRNIQLYLTSTDGRGREGVIQISYNWSLALIYIANFTSHNFSLRGGGRAVWYHSL